MKLIISPKDNGNKLVLQNVETFMPEGNTLGVVFNNGARRNYPFQHIWYWATEPSNLPRTKPAR
jgi:hypothetical protein